MKLFFRITWVLATAFFTQTLQAQSLPSSMQLSPAEHILYTGGQTSEGLYDESQILQLELWFSQPNYWTLLTNNYQSHTDLPATLVFEGDTFPNVGVRFKGQTSYQQTQNSQKKSFNITLDYADSTQNLLGYETLNLNNGFQDASFMREVTYLHQIRKHVPAARAAYVRLYINGQSWGIYPNVQQLNGDYIKEWFFSNDGIRWRADAPNGFGGMWGDGTAALNYLGPDTAEYQQYYTLKASKQTNPWDELVNVCDVLNNTPLANLETEVSEVLDLDRTLWFLASEIAFSDDDSYVFKGKMDYYLYWDAETERMTPLEFDGNSVMKSNATNWGAFYNETKVNYPLLNRLLAVPSIRQRYLAHLRTLVAEEMNSAEFNALVDQYDALINAEVQADTKKLYSYSQYTTEKQTLKNFVQNHRNTLSNNAEVNLIGPAISNVILQSNNGSWANPVADETPGVTVAVTSTNGLATVSLYYSPAVYGHFTKTQMFDDGQHNDGASGDGVFGVQMPGFEASTFVRFYIEAKSANAAGTLSYLPTGAEHNVFYYEVTAPWTANAQLSINEILASNQNGATDEFGEHDDWVELYNLTNQDVNLSGYHISDNPVGNPNKWKFPDGTVLAALGYLILWADEDSSQGPLHMNFRLSAGGESLLLSDSTGAIVDTVTFGQQITDLGYARVPNGTGNFIIQDPTFAGNNAPVPTTEPDSAAQTEINISPNPARELITITLQGENEETNLLITDVTGRVIRALDAVPQQKLDVSDWPSGIYLLKWGKVTAKLIVE